ncbi:MAG TPA: ammonia-forming cytochrome c nitrite reductase subunit c552 [Leptospiraceae bacterium]|nr:ammonia-forming cytochrome c nitrite reductase subunit c552 [Leptospiraceae bacterium]
MKINAFRNMLLLLFSIGCSAFLYAEIGNCADCHMMEKQFSVWMKDGHRTAANCIDCYHADEKEMKGSVEQIQDRNYELRNPAMKSLTDLIFDIKTIKDKGADISRVQSFQRKTQFFRILQNEFAEFNAPQERAGILGKSVDCSGKRQNSLNEK